ncbi:CHAT domain-containing protein [Streptomyces zhihengii]
MLPAPLTTALLGAGPHDLLILPAGELWRVPWGALPLPDGRLLGEVSHFVVCPSLTIQRQLATREGATDGPRVPVDVDVWRSPLVKHHPMELFRDHRWNPRRLTSAAEARDAVCEGRTLMVLTGHGRPRPETRHYLELDRDTWLLPTDLLGRRPPRRLALIACWGSTSPGRAPGDPISIATLALAGGSDEVLATVGELGDSAPATRYVEMVLNALPEHGMAAAVHRATRRFLSRREYRSLPVLDWAPSSPSAPTDPPEAAMTTRPHQALAYELDEPWPTGGPTPPSTCAPRTTPGSRWPWSIPRGSPGWSSADSAPGAWERYPARRS